MRRIRLGVMVSLALAGCVTRFERRPISEHEVLRGLQAVRLDTARPPLSAGGAVPPKSGFDASDGLCAEESVAVALAMNPGLRAFRRERGVAEGERVAAGILENPSLDLTWLHIPNFTKSFETGALDLGLSWAPPRPGERQAKVAAAGERVAQVREEIAGEEWRVAAEVRKAYASLWGLEQQFRYVDLSSQFQEKVRGYLRDRRAGGEASRLDVSLAEIEYGDVLRRKEGLSADRDAARQALNRLLGLPPLAEVPIQSAGDPLAYRAFVLDPARLESLMIDHRPDLRAAKHEYEKAEEDLHVACIQSMPWIRFGPSYAREGSPGEGSIDKFGVGLGIDLPFANRNQGEIARLTASREKLREEFTSKVHEGRAEVHEALREMKARERLVRLFEDSLQPALVESEGLIAAGFEAKEFDLLRLLTMQDKAIESRSAHVDTLRQYWDAVFDLERALGMRLVETQKEKE